MLGSDGLVAIIITVHQGALILSGLLASLILIPVWLLMRKRRWMERAFGCGLSFLAMWAVTHLLVSVAARSSPAEVEVVKIGRTAADPPAPHPPGR